MVKSVLVAIAALLVSSASTSYAFEIGTDSVEQDPVAAASSASQLAPPTAPPQTLDEVLLIKPQLANLNDEDLLDVIHDVYYPTVDRSRLAAILHHTPRSAIAAKNAEMFGTAIFWIVAIAGVIGYYHMKRRGEWASRTEKKEQVPVAPIGGALMFLIVSLGILTPALNLGSHRAALEFNVHYSDLVQEPHWATYRCLTWLVLGGLSAFSIFASLRLRFYWNPKSISLARGALIAWPAGALTLSLLLPRLIFANPMQSTAVPSALNIAVSVFFTAAWLFYLSRAQQVKVLYNLATPPKSGAASENNPLDISADQNATHPLSEPVSDMCSEEAEHGHYEIIGRELEQGTLHTSTWLKAFADADGDNDKAKARYIKLRLASLMRAVE